MGKFLEAASSWLKAVRIPSEIPPEKGEIRWIQSVGGAVDRLLEALGEDARERALGYERGPTREVELLRWEVQSAVVNLISLSEPGGYGWTTILERYWDPADAVELGAGIDEVGPAAGNRSNPTLGKLRPPPTGPDWQGDLTRLLERLHEAFTNAAPQQLIGDLLSQLLIILGFALATTESRLRSLVNDQS